MDYEKKYNEALKRAKAAIDVAADRDLVKGVASTIFPELAESEDERIRKALIWHLKAGEDFVSNGVTKEECIAYLEKQKEHQSYSDAQEKALGRDLTSPLDKDKDLDEIAQDYVDRVKKYNPEPTWDLMQTAVCYGYYCREQEEQKPAEWSEEDEKMLAAISKALGCDTAEKTLVNEGVTLVMAAGFLESLRPPWKPSEVCYGAKGDPDPAGVWKPSEEQIHAIVEALKYLPNNKDEWRILNTLVDVFKKLM